MDILKSFSKYWLVALALFLLSNENSNSFALTTNAYKGSKFKFQQIEPKSIWLQPERGNLSMYNRRVMPLCSKTLRKKTDPWKPCAVSNRTPAIEPHDDDDDDDDDDDLNSIVTPSICLRRWYTVQVRLYFVCLFPCISRAHELMYSEGNHCGALLYVNRRPWRR